MLIRRYHSCPLFLRKIYVQTYLLEKSIVSLRMRNEELFVEKVGHTHTRRKRRTHKKTLNFELDSCKNR